MFLKTLKVAGMFLVAWAGLILVIDGFMYMSTEGVFDLGQMLRFLPITALLCLFPSVMFLADYLRKN